MSGIKALEKMKEALEACRHTEKTDPPFDTYWITVDACNACIEELEAEIAERFMELPVDADGVPIRVGDTLECHANGYDGVFDAFAIGDGCVIGNHPECELFNNPFKGIHVARYCHHVKPRTIEDVLLDAGVSRACVEDVAAELRELMGGGE